MKEKLKQRKKIVIIICAIIGILIIAGVGIVVVNSKKGENIAKENTKTNTINANVDKINAENDKEIQEIMKQDASGDNVPVPEGYVGSSATGENEIDTGYVIYEGTEPVTDSNVETAKTTRNQYVWVPVPDASKMYGTDANGKKWGKLYDFATSSSNKNYDELTGSYPNNWSETNGIMKITSGTSYREPDVVRGSDINSTLKTKRLGVESTQEFLMQLEKEFNNMIKSVEKYGGFYIGRYETGDLGEEKAVVVKGNSDIGSQTWYEMYKKCKELKGSNNKVETSMIWGSQWDRTLMWLVESEDKTKEQICDSRDWGNYSNSTGEAEAGSGSKRPTGYSESWKANNIYDLAGNVYDWTMEANSSNRRVLRGGYYDYSGGSYPARGRNYRYPTDSSYSYGCRGALYIK